MNTRRFLTASLLVFSACTPISTLPTEIPQEPSATVLPAGTIMPVTPGGDGAVVATCPMFPTDNIWNTRVDNLPIHAMSEAWIDSIGSEEGLHMDFGSGVWDGGTIGIPYNIVSGSSVTKYTLAFYYPDESDAGPYPIPGDPLMEYSSDHHILVVDTEDCRLYEIYDASVENGSWSGGSGAVWDLNSNALRPTQNMDLGRRSRPADPAGAGPLQ
jgi:hypothetical protein